ncbi:Uncharacterised protein [Legionella beliardensis]|uniref:Uncharacterized protein n=1 Tax=Legionella beliardensis TaxID=91822 RepID=A0A378I612_9GAMM|nr:hypothetical protein [Legionella beliardensis]STX30175.1 Uncharacterised protein [Legionella beliardensis]
MRSKIEEELSKAKERYEAYQEEAKGYDGRDPAERYLFFMGVNQLIDGTSQEICRLENELKQCDNTNSTNTP